MNYKVGDLVKLTDVAQIFSWYTTEPLRVLLVDATGVFLSLQYHSESYSLEHILFIGVTMYKSIAQQRADKIRKLELTSI